MVHVFHLQEEFNRMRKRHELMKTKYPDHEEAQGIPDTGITNARPGNSSSLEGTGRHEGTAI